MTADTLTLDRFWSIRLLLVAAVALIVIAAVVALSQRHAPAPGVATELPPGAAQPAAAALPPGNGLPVLVMPPFEVSGTPGPRSIAARSLQETLSDAFTHFDLVNVQLEAADHQAAAGNEAAPARNAHADYRFSGSIEYADDGAARLLFRLIDVADGSIVWSRVIDRVLGGDDKAVRRRADRPRARRHIAAAVRRDLYPSARQSSRTAR